MQNDIQHNLAIIRQRIALACLKANRVSDSVSLLLATKTVTAQRIAEALNAGITLIGENKVQELKEKYVALKNLAHQKNFIGHLQTNKIKDLLKYGVNCIHSLDRSELAEKLHQRLVIENRNMDVLIQVNTSREESKFGVAPENAIDLVKQVAALHTLKIKGLMTIGKFSADEETTRSCFRLLKNLQQEVIAAQIANVSMAELSMGMSNDLEIAIEEGATIVRVGTAVFGARILPDQHYWNESRG